MDRGNVHLIYIVFMCYRRTSYAVRKVRSAVTDNGTGFTSEQFRSFLKDNGAKHITSAPYHPASNGLAEHAVQIVKKGLKKVTTGSMNTRLAKVLCNYRVTPQSTNGISPPNFFYIENQENTFNQELIEL